MRVETNEYFNAHGKAPRGFGGWWFQLLDATRRDQGDFTFTGTYTEARKAAVAKAKEMNCTTVRVLS